MTSIVPQAPCSCECTRIIYAHELEMFEEDGYTIVNTDTTTSPPDLAGDNPHPLYGQTSADAVECDKASEEDTLYSSMIVWSGMTSVVNSQQLSPQAVEYQRRPSARPGCNETNSYSILHGVGTWGPDQYHMIDPLQLNADPNECLGKHQLHRTPTMPELHSEPAPAQPDIARSDTI